MFHENCESNLYEWNFTNQQSEKFALNQAVAKALKSTKTLNWFEVSQRSFEVLFKIALHSTGRIHACVLNNSVGGD
jgi:hypothetical protein